MFVNTLFSFFEATGMDTFDEMIANGRTSAEKIITSIKNLPKEQQVALVAVMGGLLKSGRQVVRKDIRNRRKLSSKYRHRHKEEFKQGER
jgi:hypothetical protein